MTPPRLAWFVLLLAAGLTPAAFGQAPVAVPPKSGTVPPAGSTPNAGTVPTAGSTPNAASVPQATPVATPQAVPAATPELVPLIAPTGGAGLFVGVNEFADPSGKVGNLRFAVNDAIEQCHLFALELRLIPPQNCTLALSGEPEGEPATAHLAALQAAGATVVEARKSPILIALSQTCAKATGPSDLLIVACSSHGFSEGETAYLMPKDGLFEYLADTAVQLATVEGRLRLSTAGHRMLLVDACQNRVSGKKSLTGAAGAMSPAFAAALAKPTGQVKIASCDVGQFSLELPTLQHGVFTAALLEALRGGAADADGDGLIRLNEVEPAMTARVAAHLAAYNRDLPEADRIEQSPTFHGPAAARRLPLAVPATDLEALIGRLAAKVGVQGYTADLHGRLSAALTAGTANPDLRRETERFADGGGRFFALIAEQELTRLMLVTVAADGSGDHRTIAAALAAVPAGGLVRVLPGVYPENPLVVDRPLTLQGVGPREQIVVEVADGSALHLTAPPAANAPAANAPAANAPAANAPAANAPAANAPAANAPAANAPAAAAANVWAASAVTVRGLTLRCTAPPEVPAAGLKIDAGRPLVEDCVILSSSLSGVQVTGAGTAPTVRGCRVADGAYHGLFVAQKAGGEYEDCQFVGNAASGVVVEGAGADPTLRRCEVKGSKESGLFVFGGAAGTYEDCRFDDNVLNGIDVADAGTNPTLRRCGADRNREVGGAVYDGAGGTYEDCTFVGSTRIGVRVANAGTAPTFLRCRATDGLQSGLLVHEGAAGTYEDCVFVGNALSGIEVADAGTNPTLTGCRAERSEGNGLYAYGGAGGTFKDCAFVGNKGAGIAVKEAGTSPTIRGGRATGNGYEGVWVRDNARATVTGLDLRGNQRGAWDIEASAGTVTRSENRE